jgi:hypothetical protein
MIGDQVFLAGIARIMVEMAAGACTPEAMGRGNAPAPRNFVARSTST